MDDAQQLNNFASIKNQQIPNWMQNIFPNPFESKAKPSVFTNRNNLQIPGSIETINTPTFSIPLTTTISAVPEVTTLVTSKPDRSIGGLTIKRKDGVDYKMSKGLQTGLTAATAVLDTVVPDNLDASQKAMKSSMKSLISLAGPIGTAINFADSGLNMIGSIAGLQLDKMDNVAASRAGVSSAGLNNTIMSIPVVGALGGFMAGKTHKSYKSGEIDDMRGAYGGSAGDIDAAQNLGNKRFLFGKKKANRFIDQANRYNELITDISTENKLRKQNTYGSDLASQNYIRFQGLNPNRMLIGKTGMKIPVLEKAREILLNLTTNLPIYKTGGKLNIIVEGSLHARKNNLENTNSNLKGCITKKGIPVISYSDGNIIQHAEIEGGELILNKELTEQLEQLYKKGTEEAMIKAGKLLSIALIKDTEDKSGITKNIK